MSPTKDNASLWVFILYVGVGFVVVPLVLLGEILAANAKTPDAPLWKSTVGVMAGLVLAGGLIRLVYHHAKSLKSAGLILAGSLTGALAFFGVLKVFFPALRF